LIASSLHMNYKIRICLAVECKNCGNDDLFKEALRWAKPRKHIAVEKRHCMARCEMAPNIQVMDGEGKEVACYSKVTPQEMRQIIEAL
jgi:NADH:ubiquinone oxidoreductase subunit E